MWCFCFTPEEQLRWESISSCVNLNINKVRKLGKKCIVNKQIGRKDVYVENDFVECFERIGKGLQALRELALDFLTTANYHRVRSDYEKKKIQEQFLQFQHNAQQMNENSRQRNQMQQRNDEDTEETSFLENCEDEENQMNETKASAGNYSYDDYPTTSQMQMPSFSDNSFLEDVAKEGTRTFFKRCKDYFSTDVENAAKKPRGKKSAKKKRKNMQEPPTGKKCAKGNSKNKSSVETGVKKQRPANKPEPSNLPKTKTAKVATLKKEAPQKGKKKGKTKK